MTSRRKYVVVRVHERRWPTPPRGRWLVAVVSSLSSDYEAYLLDLERLRTTNAIRSATLFNIRELVASLREKYANVYTIPGNDRMSHLVCESRTEGDILLRLYRVLQ